MNKKKARIRRATRARCRFRQAKVARLIVHRTSRHIYAQVLISDNISRVLVTASTLEKKISNKLQYTGNKQAAELVGTKIAERAIHHGIKHVSFDRSGFKYHGRIKILADAARESGLHF